MGISPPSCHLADGYTMPSGPSYQRAHCMYPAAPQHAPMRYPLDHMLPGVLACSPAHATSVSTFVPNTYQHTIVGDSFQTAASLFPTLDVSELCSAAAHQKAYGSRASPTTGRSLRPAAISRHTCQCSTRETSVLWESPSSRRTWIRPIWMMVCALIIQYILLCLTVLGSNWLHVINYILKMLLIRLQLNFYGLHVGVGDKTKILYHNMSNLFHGNDIFHNIVIFA